MTFAISPYNHPFLPSPHGYGSLHSRYGVLVLGGKTKLYSQRILVVFFDLHGSSFKDWCKGLTYSVLFKTLEDGAAFQVSIVESVCWDVTREADGKMPRKEEAGKGYTWENKSFEKNRNIRYEK